MSSLFSSKFLAMRNIMLYSVIQLWEAILFDWKKKGKKMDITCAICLESFTPNCEVSSTPCGHLFHSACLFKSVTSNQNTCPTCRQPCSQNIHRVYLQGAQQNSQQGAHSVAQVSAQTVPQTGAQTPYLCGNLGQWDILLLNLTSIDFMNFISMYHL